MFIGHYSAAFIAATHPKAPPLAALFVGAQLVDFGFFSLALAGVEAMRITPGFTVMNPMDLYHMPYTHSLLGGALWAIGFTLLLRIILTSWTPAIIGGAVVLSHWFIDLLVHSADLTLWGSPPKLGFGLWNHPLIEMPLEIALTFGTMWLFLRATTPTRKSYAVPVLIVVLLALQAFNWFAPPPASFEPSQPIMALIAFVILTALALWVGRTRIFKVI
jgi:hypothetical protein